MSWFLDHDREDGHPALIGMLMEGVVIGPRPEIAYDFKKRAAQYTNKVHLLSVPRQ